MAIELWQRKTQEEVETGLREWMENRFVTKEEFHKELGLLRAEMGEKMGSLKAEMGEKMGSLKAEMGNLKAELIKWMFIFWVGQIAAFTAIVKLLGK